jgi:hypothetical protein
VFTNTSDVVTATVRALSGWKSRAPDAAAREAAAARVRELAGGHNNAAGVASCGLSRYRSSAAHYWTR